VFYIARLGSFLICAGLQASKEDPTPAVSGNLQMGGVQGAGRVYARRSAGLPFSRSQASGRERGGSADATVTEEVYTLPAAASVMAKHNLRKRTPKHVVCVQVGFGLRVGS
jgi:hypothetical protein